MKASRANELRSIVALVLLFGGEHARAQSPLSASVASAQVTVPLAQNPPSSAANVAAVRIVTQDGKVLSDAPTDLAVQPGKPLDHNQVAESIRKLYRSGAHSDVKVTVTTVEGGMRVDFVVTEQVFFN